MYGYRHTQLAHRALARHLEACSEAVADASRGDLVRSVIGPRITVAGRTVPNDSAPHRRTGTPT